MQAGNRKPILRLCPHQSERLRFFANLLLRRRHFLAVWKRPLHAGASTSALAALLLLSGCIMQPSQPSVGVSAPPTPVVTVESGVLALTSRAEEESVAAAAPAGAAPGPAASVDTLAGLEVFEVGAEVQARGQLRLYAAAEPETVTLAEYEAGDRFIIMGPPGDVLVYPVELGGVRWYRVRAADGLVGWVMADGIEPVAHLE
ncbi:MAG: hypothetical protein NZ553_16280 [Caldilinea sp.]|nr:hypothetical protein [Caldilinea sp.]MDW8442036.1 hypothetical protein [Caldilineaceae bacterium]